MSSATKPPLTVIIGAGLSQAIGIPGTAELTEAARSLKMPTINLGSTPGTIGVPLADLVWKALNAYYDMPNFETMIHGIEALLSVQTGVAGANIPDISKPVTNAFMDVTPRWRTLAAAPASDLADLASAILDRVGGQVAIAAARASSHPNYSNFTLLLQRLCQEFEATFVDLNYDDTADAVLPNAIDGFGPGDGMPFDWKVLRSETKRPRLLHAHGSIRFGVSQATGYPTIQKFSHVADATKHWLTIDVFAQSGERMLVGPMITGLRKADKTLWAPYGHYLHYIIDAIFRGSRVLTIGYGGSDSHINQWLLQWLLLHGADAKYATVTKFDDLIDLPDDPVALRLASAVMRLEKPSDLKLLARTHPNDFKNRVLLWKNAMIDGNGLPDPARLDALIAFLK